VQAPLLDFRPEFTVILTVVLFGCKENVDSAFIPQPADQGVLIGPEGGREKFSCVGVLVRCRAKVAESRSGGTPLFFPM